MLGIDSTTIEINPFLADAIQAKLTRYDSDEVVKVLADIRRRSRRSPVDPYEFFQNDPRPSFNLEWRSAGFSTHLLQQDLPPSYR